MAFVELTVYKKDSDYFNPPIVIPLDLSAGFTRGLKGYRSLDEEIARTPTGTKLIFRTGTRTWTWVVGETEAEILALINSGGGGTPTTQYSTVTFPFSQTINYLVGDVQQSVLFTEDFTSFTELHVGTISVNNLSIKDKKHYKDLIDSANAIVITLPDEAAGVPEIGTTTYYIGYSSAILEQAIPDKNSPQWIIKRVIERETGETVTSYAQGNSLLFNLVFDSGLQEYLTYLY
jgi:hypothetical protein